MSITHAIESALQNAAMFVVDQTMAAIPRPCPTPSALQQAKVVAHRGTHDHGLTTKENTLKAFERAVQAGAWGIEFDIRFTRDSVPVILHDESALRVFGDVIRPSELTLDELKKRQPEIPTFAEVKERFGQKLHLMIELKKLKAAYSPTELRVLEEMVKGLTPETDFHFIGLTPEIFKQIEFVPRRAFIPVAEINTAEMSELALKEGYGGFAGHYALITDERIKRHRDKGQKVGSGFPRSKNVLRRELLRGVDWIFTNHVPEITSFLKADSTAAIGE